MPQGDYSWTSTDRSDVRHMRGTSRHSRNPGSGGRYPGDACRGNDRSRYRSRLSLSRGGRRSRGTLIRRRGSSASGAACCRVRSSAHPKLRWLMRNFRRDLHAGSTTCRDGAAFTSRKWASGPTARSPLSPSHNVASLYQRTTIFVGLQQRFAFVLIWLRLGNCSNDDLIGRLSLRWSNIVNVLDEGASLIELR